MTPRARAWTFSSAIPGSVSEKASVQRHAERVHDRIDRDLQVPRADRLRHGARVASGLGGGEARRHRDADDVLGPERLGRERGRQRRVDPARDSEDDVREAVLALRSRGGRARSRAASPPARPPARRPTTRSEAVPRTWSPRTSTTAASGSSRRAGRARAAARRGAAVRRPSSRRRRRAAAPPRRPGPRTTTSPFSSRTRLWPSKISSSCAPTALTSTIQHELSRARVASISSRSAPLPTWNGEAEMFATTCAPASARSVAGGPGCQMSSQTVGPTSVSPQRRRTSPRPGWK